MSSSLDPAKLIANLDPDAIRSRLADLDAEESALRVLLRAALARRRGRDKPADDGRSGVSNEQ